MVNGKKKFRKLSEPPQDIFPVEDCKMVKRCIKEGDDFKMKKFTPDEAPEVSFPFNECNKNKEKKNRDESKRQKLPGKKLVYSFSPPPRHPFLAAYSHSLCMAIYAHAPTATETCELVESQQEVECPKPPPVPLPVKCAGASASWSGDPHMVTFDKVKYDCQGQGEFHVVKSLDSGFSLQGRFIKYRQNRFPTVTRSLAFNSGEDNEKTIQVNVPDTASDGICTPTFLMDGVAEQMQEDEVTIGDLRIKRTTTSNSRGFIFYYESTGVQLKVTAKFWNGCYLAADLCLPDCYKRRGESFVGLLGTPDGDNSNDWMDSSGYNLPFNSNRKAQTNYCTANWCIENQAESIFHYNDNGQDEKGKSFDDYNNCNLGPDSETEACMSNPDRVVPGLTDICKKDEACLLDGCVGGIEAAKLYVHTVLGMVDKNCGKELLYEDFEDPDDEGWGTIAKMSEGDGASFLRLSKGANSASKSLDIPGDASLVEIE